MPGTSFNAQRPAPWGSYAWTLADIGQSVVACHRGDLLVTGEFMNDRARIRVFSVQTGEELRSYPGHLHEIVLALAISPDDSTLVVGEYSRVSAFDLHAPSGSPPRWSCETPPDLETSDRHQHVRELAVSPDGKLVAAVHGGPRASSLRVWELAHGERLVGERDAGISVDFAPDGRLLVVRQAALRVLSATTGAELDALPLGSPGSTARALADGRAAVALMDGSIELQDLAHRRPTQRLAGHPGGGVTLAESAGGLVSGGYDQLVSVWDLASGARLHALSGHTRVVHAVCAIPRTDLAASVGSDHALLLWDVRAGTPARVRDGHVAIRGLAVLPGGDVLAAGLDGVVRRWDPSGQLASRFAPEPRCGILSLAVDPDGRRAWFGTQGEREVGDPVGTTWALDLAGARAGRSVLHRGGSAKQVVRVGEWCVSADSDRKVRVHGVDETEARELAELSLTGLAVAGPSVVGASDGGTILVFSAVPPASPNPIGEHPGVRAVGVSPSGDRIATAGRSSVKVWSFRGEGASSYVVDDEQTCVAFTNDEQAVVVGSRDGAVTRLWLGSDRAERFEVGHDDWPTAIAVDPRGAFVVVGTERGVIYRLEL
jgi:WD40 repeat protein